MPTIDVTYPEGTFTLEQKQQIVNDLSHALIKAEGNANNARSLSTVWVYLHETRGGEYAVGGQLQQDNPQRRYRVEVQLPDGILDDERKNGLVADVTRILLEAEGSTLDLLQTLRVYCLIHEIRDGNWGTANKGLRLAEMRALAAAR